MSQSPDITAEATTYIEQLFQEQLPPTFVYHNLAHTMEIVRYALEIGKVEGCTEEELEVLELAGLFHDAGYIRQYKEHEAASMEIAQKFLSSKGYPDAKLQQVIGCIKATEMPQTPQSPLEEVMCDADLIHLGKYSFFERGDRLREEWRHSLEMKMTDLEWYQNTLQFMEKHNYHTAYTQDLMGVGKKANIQKIREMVEEHKGGDLKDSKESKESKENDQGTSRISEKDRKQLTKEIKAQLKQKTPDRGVETMFRTSSRNHIQLSAIADNKANIMLSINALIVSIVVSALVPRLDDAPFLVFPSAILLVVCILSIVFATLSTIPKVTQGTFTKDDIKNRRANLLFFGNFHNMDLEEFQWGMNEMMVDRDFLYGSMTRDLYFLGKVLNRKYKFLRFCYNVFMFGLILAVATFMVAYMVR